VNFILNIVENLSKKCLTFDYFSVYYKCRGQVIEKRIERRMHMYRLYDFKPPSPISCPHKPRYIPFFLSHSHFTQTLVLSFRPTTIPFFRPPFSTAPVAFASGFSFIWTNLNIYDMVPSSKILQKINL